MLNNIKTFFTDHYHEPEKTIARWVIIAAIWTNAIAPYTPTITAYAPIAVEYTARFFP